MVRLLFYTTTLGTVLRASLCTSFMMETACTAKTATLKAADFEVFGKVQGVFFRKHTKQEADKLGLRGWCRNTSKGTVQGHIEGPNEQVTTMMNWLKKTGSPNSRIEKAEFSNVKHIEDYTLTEFDIRKDA